MTKPKKAGAKALATRNCAVEAAERAVRVDRFAEGTELRTSAIDVQLSVIRQLARMADSDHPDLRQAGLEKLRMIAALSLGSELQPQLTSRTNSSNAKGPRGKRVNEPEIAKEFKRLVREGFTRREANGKLFAQGYGARSTINGITKLIDD
jgi:hypothetical protein